MRLRHMAASFLLVWIAGPALAGPQGCPDTDGDTVSDCTDNCSDVANADQFDADGDLCGNRCDGDFDQNGVVSVVDLSNMIINGYGTTISNFDVQSPHDTLTGGGITVVDLSDLILNKYGTFPGPSGTTPGTTACP